MTRYTALFIALGLVACGGKDSDEGAGCADPYDGDAPSPLGDFTVSSFDETWTNDCDQNTPQYRWLDDPFNIDGYAPDGLRIHFDDGSALNGVILGDGGMVFSGKRTDLPEAAIVHIALSGLIYRDADLSGRAKWSAFATIGYDTEGDGNVDCRAFGDVTAIQSDGS